MDDRKILNCIIAGEGPLPIQCGEILLNNGHSICAIISQDPSLVDWAKDKNIPWVIPRTEPLSSETTLSTENTYSQARMDLVNFVRKFSFDYLFCIVNYHTLPKELFQCPKEMIINYHDALLPKYGGFYVTSWALINKEKTHGVDWHEMNEITDGGDKLIEYPIQVSEEETAYSLNVKCYDAAIQSFNILLEDLAFQRAVKKKQNLKERTFYSLYQRPEAGGVLCWKQNAEDIHALIRALSFEHSSNPVGLPLCYVGGEFLIVNKLKNLKLRSNELPGTITEIAQNYIRVATGNHLVEIRGFSTIYGQPVSISRVVDKFELYEGYQLPELDSSTLKRISRLTSSFAEHEVYWVKRLQDIQPIGIPLVDDSKTDVNVQEQALMALDLPELVISAIKRSPHPDRQLVFMMASFGAYLSRNAELFQFDIGFMNLVLKECIGLESLFEQVMPFRFEIDSTQTHAQLALRVRKQLHLVNETPLYPKHIFSRFAVLRLRQSEQRFPVMIQAVGTIGECTSHSQSLLTLVVPEDLRDCQWKYNSQVLSEDFIAEFASQFNHFILGIVSEIHAPISKLPVLSREVRNKILLEFNDANLDFPSYANLHELFEKQVERSPLKIALVCEEQKLTYHELNRKANQIAHYLEHFDLGSERLVGVCLDRSFEMVAVLLGILKANAAYIPLDPEYPKERIKFMIEDSQCSLILTQNDCIENIPQQDAIIVNLDSVWSLIEKEDFQNPDWRGTLDSPAYLIYTSGTTGKPKGVLIPHRAICNHMLWIQNQFAFGENERILQKTPFSFDASVWEFYAPLLVGGQLIVARPGGHKEIAYLIETIIEQHITIIQVVPSILQLLVENSRFTDCKSLRIVFCGGEPLSRDLCRRFYSLLDADLCNLYGPTETCIDATFWVCPRDPEKVLIGRPIANAQIYLLDRSLQPVPVGAPGELHIGGDGLACGYHNRPQLTKEKFIPNPFSSDSNARLYKTGDLARFLSDGTLELLGRLDNQVKVRGMRIELGEIESILLEHPDVTANVVLCREEYPTGKMIVAYMIWRQSECDKSAAIKSLQKFLRDRLPDYMIPEFFIFLDNFPLTPNGKINRRALPAPESGSRLKNAKVLAPQSPLEYSILMVWREILGVEQLGIDDNFFSSGGHSLLAIRLIARLQDQGGYYLTLKQFLDHPTVAGLATVLRNAVEDRRSSAAVRLEQIDRTRPIPLSYSQERLWFLQQLDPDSHAYVIPLAVRLTGALDVAALEQSLNVLIARHEILRTQFIQIDGKPQQTIIPPFSLPLSVIDLQSETSVDPEKIYRGMMEENVTRPFNLAQDPLLRAAVYRLAPDQHVFALTFHHIVVDAGSLDIFCQELAHLYQVAKTNRPSSLSPLSIQYADFAVWQRKYYTPEYLEMLFVYWKSQLADAPPYLSLPTDRPRPALQTYSGANVHRALSRALIQDVTHFARSEGVTVFMTFLAVFQLLLSRHSGEKDIVVGAPAANRPQVELERVMGLFLNSLALRTRVSEKRTVREFVGQVRDVCLGAYAHQDLPFEKLVQELQPHRDLSRTPLFQVFFNLLDDPFSQFQLPGLKSESAWNPEEASAKFDLTLYAFLQPDGWSLNCSYNTDLFDRTTILWLMEHFEMLLIQFVNRPEAPLSTLSVFGRTGKPCPGSSPVQITSPSGFQPFAPVSSELTIVQRFEEQVEQYPHLVAVKHHGWALNYSELNHQANHLAHTLLARIQNQERPSPIGILCDPGPALVSAILGVLKTGCPYVPLDPLLPVNRLKAISTDAMIRTIVYTKKTAAQVVELSQQVDSLINFDADVLENNEGNPALEIAADSLAYILYTSGTTGQPKGVMQSHRNVLNHIRAYTNNVKISPGDHLTLLASFSFDAAVMDIFGALLNGACLCPFSLHDESINALPDWLIHHGITVYHSTPTVFRYWVNQISATESFPRMRLVILGGEEAMSSDLVAFQQQFGHDCVFVNGFGPTESTVATQFFANHQTSLFGRSIPIGSPVEGTEVVLLDQEGLPTDLFGEIVLKSPSVALGYWKQPELTARVFEEGPSGTRIRHYHTGDFGRYRPDGTLEFIGRRDSQVKLRGFRIELAEIENTLLRHSTVKEVVVLARTLNSEEVRLVAYVVLLPGTTLIPHTLRTFLQSHLPEYMVPGSIVQIPAVPLTPNGKVDRRALLRIELPSQPISEQSPPPQTSVELLLAEVWCSLLKLDHVGVHDNFFELGGHSLLATQVAAHIQSTMRVVVSLGDFFEYPTIAQLAKIIQKSQTTSGVHPLPIPTIRKGEVFFPLSLTQERFWFLDQLSPGNTAYLSMGGLQMTGPLHYSVLEQSLNAVVERHESLRTTFSVRDESPVQRIVPRLRLTLLLEDFQHLSGEVQSRAIDRRVQQEVKTPFDLSTGPLIRATLLRLSSEEHVFLLVLHHIVTDGWSRGIFYRELGLFYNAFLEGRAPALPTHNPVQYGDYAVWQRQGMQGERLDHELRYWKTRLDGLSVLELPTDRPRPPIQTFEGTDLSFMLPDSVAQGLKNVTSKAGCTLFMTLLAAFQILLHRYAGQEDIVVGIPIAGRIQKELEHSIGLFINTLVLRTNLEKNPTFREVLKQVRNTTLEAYAHQVIPFEQLIEKLNPRRNPSFPPIFQVLFVLDNLPEREFTLSHLRVSRYFMNPGTAMVDLSLSMQEMNGTLLGNMRYNVDLFNHETIERMVHHFEILLKGVVDNPDRNIHDLPLLAESERTQILVEWNAHSLPSLEGASIPHLFEQQVARTPAATALYFDEQHLSYEALNAKANQLARVLRRQGVTPEVRVGLYLERGPKMIIGLLGILKAGGIYVPLAPEYPEERLRFILNDAAISVVVTSNIAERQLPQSEGLRRVLLDTDWVSILCESEANLEHEIQGQHLAYILYSSGSTGFPKGVMVSHESLVNYVETARRDFSFCAEDRVLQFASIGFDVSAEEIFPCLFSGGTLVLRTDFMLDSWKTFWDYCQTWGLSVLDLPTSFWQEWITGMQEESLSVPPCLRLMIIGGEQACLEYLAQWQALTERSTQLVNAYGPTETTVNATYWNCAGEDLEYLSIGRPIANMQSYILDEYLQPVPIGVPGELFIGGAGLARGYLNQPGMTAQRFLPNPFVSTPFSRLYKTGDLARYRSDSMIEFLGRRDFQVKVRGFRIELGEIETMLNQHPLVQEGVVVAWEERVGEKRLVAYFVWKEGRGSTNDIRHFLRENLPEYMVPGVIMELKVFPRNTSGKVDRGALPQPDWQELQQKYIAPQTPLEELLTQVWQEVLKVDRVGIQDDFFELGGHSLLATTVITRLRKVLEMEIPLRLLFDHPSIMYMAEAIDALLDGSLADRPKG